MPSRRSRARARAGCRSRYSRIRISRFPDAGYFPQKNPEKGGGSIPRSHLRTRIASAASRTGADATLGGIPHRGSAVASASPVHFAHLPDGYFGAFRTNKWSWSVRSDQSLRDNAVGSEGGCGGFRVPQGAGTSDGTSEPDGSGAPDNVPDKQPARERHIAPDATRNRNLCAFTERRQSIEY